MYVIINDAWFGLLLRLLCYLVCLFVQSYQYDDDLKSRNSHFDIHLGPSIEGYFFMSG